MGHNVLKCLLGFVIVLSQNVKTASATPLEHPSPSSSLSFVFMITRHGARTPVVYPTGDPNNNYWKDPQGALTNVGKQELFHLGKLARLQYKDYLSKLYKPEEIKVRSTNMDRTLMSAESFTAGLYPPKDYQVWNPELAWQPIPVQILDYDVDALTSNAIKSMVASCPAVIENDVLFTKYKDTIEALQNAVGIQYVNCLNMKFFTLLDTFIVEKFNNLTLPFGLDSISAKITEVKNAAFVTLFTAPQIQAALNAPLFRDIADLLEQRSNNSSTEKAYTYFMHDANVLPFLAAVTNYPLTSPLFASSITIEMHNKRRNGGYRVEVYYRETPWSPRKLQFIKGCGNSCPLENFIALLRSPAAPPTAYPCPCQV